MSLPILYIFKIGGNIIDDDNQLNAFLKSFAQLQGTKILIHGGGKIASDISKGLGIEPKMVDGRRITDDETLKVVTMVYGGLINKNIVAKLQSFGCNAIGLSGADANILPAHKRPIKEIDYGFVGDIEEDRIPSETINMFLQNNLVPVIAPLTHDCKGNMLNTNADTISSAISIAMSKKYKVELFYCFEKTGVLKDINDVNSVIPEISFSYYDTLKKEGVINDGMMPKLDNAFLALQKGVQSVTIIHANAIDEILQNKQPKGTQLLF